MSTSIKMEQACAVGVACTDMSLIVALEDGREMRIPLDWYPRLQSAPRDKRNRWDLVDGGASINWPELDENISVAELLNPETPAAEPLILLG